MRRVGGRIANFSNSPLASRNALILLSQPIRSQLPLRTAMQKYPLLTLIVGAGVALGSAPAANAVLQLYYNFETGAATNGATVDNLVTGADGTLRFGTSGGSITYNQTGTITGIGSVAGPQILGRTLTFAPAADGNQNLEAPHIDTAFTLSALNITPGTAYTAMAWVNFGSTTGDNMIFGQGFGGNSLHHGSRNGNYHSGHWGDDVGPDQGVFVTTGTGAWHHVAFTNDSSGTQEIFVDGLSVASGATGAGGTMDTFQNLLIGTSNNGGSFSGQLDEIKIFNEVRTAAQIQQDARVIPEPNSIALLALSGFGMTALLRRRRAGR